MNEVLLSFQLLLDFITLVFGIILIVKAQKHKVKFWWGVIVVVVGAVLFFDNIGWMLIYKSNSPEILYYRSLLVAENMIKWFVLSTVVSVFPIAFLRPGYITPVKILIILIPVGALILVTTSYHLFNGEITDLFTYQSIIDNIEKQDVRLRLAIFAFTIVFPALYFIIPITQVSIKKISSGVMMVYMLSMMFLFFYYICFTLFMTDFIFNTFGIAIVVFCISFSIFFLIYESPFSFSQEELNHQIPGDILLEQISGKKALIEILSGNMKVYFESHSSYLNQDYSIDDLARELNTKPQLAFEAIKNCGYTGFHDYMNYLKIQYFKKLAKSQRGKSIKELMNESGFSSRSSFYRLFARFEHIKPKEFIKNLYSK